MDKEEADVLDQPGAKKQGIRFSRQNKIIIRY